MSTQLNRNKITITLNANNYYIQLPKAHRDEGKLETVEIAPMQIISLEIFKSYTKHVTDIEVKLDNMDPNVAAYWSEGKYVARLAIDPEGAGDRTGGFVNYFLCHNLEVDSSQPENTVHGRAPTINITVKLRSITRVRLEAENNFPMELGGKTGGDPSGAGQSALSFLHADLMLMYSKNYMEEGYDTANPWDLKYTDMIESNHQIETGPPNGFRMITNTNMEAMEYFFKHYPIFNTRHEWLLDDCDTAGGAPTKFKISDLVWWKAWEPHINTNLSKVMNREIDAGPIKSTTEFRTVAVLNYYKMWQLEYRPYYDWVSFYVKHGYPKIWAVDVSSGKPIPMQDWNGRHSTSPVLTPNGNIKIIDTPRYEDYLTYMTAKEIKESQYWLNVFQGFHPVLQKLTFSNIFVGDADIHTILEFKLDKVEDTGKFDRIAMGYQCLHTYKRKDLLPKTYTQATSSDNDADPDNSQFTKTHTLTSEVIFLVIDKGELAIEGIPVEDAVNVSADPSNYKFNEYDACAAASDLGGGGVDGVGLPGNPSVAAQARAIYATKFPYVWGGKTSTKVGLDCSGFAAMAVKAAGVGGYPGGPVTGQMRWCHSNATEISGVANAKPGDIVFFKWSGNRNFGHTGIAISNTQCIDSRGGSKNNIHNKGQGHNIREIGHFKPNTMRIYRLKGGNG